MRSQMKTLTQTAHANGLSLGLGLLLTLSGLAQANPTQTMDIEPTAAPVPTASQNMPSEPREADATPSPDEPHDQAPEALEPTEELAPFKWLSRYGAVERKTLNQP